MGQTVGYTKYVNRGDRRQKEGETPSLCVLRPLDTDQTMAGRVSGISVRLSQDNTPLRSALICRNIRMNKRINRTDIPPGHWIDFNESNVNYVRISELSTIALRSG